MRADLHVHTSCSDGAKSPAEIVAWARARGLDAVAVTDHDSVSGVAEAMRAGAQEGVKVVAGIELSTFSNCEIHILGYDFDYKNPEFQDELERVKNLRRARNLLVGQKLEALGIKLGIDYGADGLGRMNIARVMAAKGYSADVNEAFEKYLGAGRKAYAESKRLTPVEAVALIKKYGGFSSIAHPKKYLSDNRLEMLISGLKKFGLNGLETDYPTHSDADRKALINLAQKYNLLPTGGSDYHGEEDKNFVFYPDPRLTSRLKLNTN